MPIGFAAWSLVRPLEIALQPDPESVAACVFRRRKPRLGAAVDACHAAGLAQGGTDEGAPGLRDYGPDFYACYLRDPDGNKLSAVCDQPG